LKSEIPAAFAICFLASSTVVAAVISIVSGSFLIGFLPAMILLIHHGIQLTDWDLRRLSTLRVYGLGDMLAEGGPFTASTEGVVEVRYIFWI
jgi:hypothetical protein